MKTLVLSLVALAIASSAVASPPVQPPAAPYGTWQNPRHSIAVRIAPCGTEICGQIVAATPAALQDARDSGVQKLIGVQLLSDYRQVRRGRWDGTVFVPDMGRSFSSHIVQIQPNTLRISGCLIAGMLCKSQDWTRL